MKDGLPARKATGNINLRFRCESSGEVTGLRSGTAAVLIRPEDVRISDTGVATTVTSARRRDGAWILTCALEDGAEIAARSAERVVEGTEVFVSVDLDNVSLLA